MRHVHALLSCQIGDCMWLLQRLIVIVNNGVNSLKGGNHQLLREKNNHQSEVAFFSKGSHHSQGESTVA